MTAQKDKVKQELKQLFKLYLEATRGDIQKLRELKYNAVREFCLATDTLKFKDIETMEATQKQLNKS